MKEDQRDTLILAMRYEPGKVVELLESVDWSEIELMYRIIFKK